MFIFVNLKFVVYKFLARSVGHLCLSSHFPSLRKEVAPIAIPITGPMIRSKSKALAQQSFELQPVIT